MMNIPPFMLQQLQQRFGQQPGMPSMPQGMPQKGTFSPQPFEGGIGGLPQKPKGPPQLGIGFGRGHFGPPMGLMNNGGKVQRY